MTNWFGLKKCCKCNDVAVWYYMPSGEREEADRFFCDNCIKRGCSCNWISDDEQRLMIDESYTGIEDNPVNPFKQTTDAKGRLLPCCEYEYNECGWPDLSLPVRTKINSEGLARVAEGTAELGDVSMAGKPKMTAIEKLRTFIKSNFGNK